MRYFLLTILVVVVVFVDKLTQGLIFAFFIVESQAHVLLIVLLV